MSKKNKIEYQIPPNSDSKDFDDLMKLKDKIESRPATVEVALNLPGDEGVKEIINLLNDKPVGTPAEIIEMDWA